MARGTTWPPGASGVLRGLAAALAVCGGSTGVRAGAGEVDFRFVTPAPIRLSIGFEPGAQAFTFGDTDCDGRPDLVAIDQVVGAVAIVPNQGDGHFGAARSFPLDAFPTAVAVAPLNGDDQLDVVVADDGGVATTLKGDGHGGLEIVEQLDVGLEFNGVAIADLDRDSALDLALLDLCDEIVLQQNRGDGTFQCFPEELLDTEGDDPISIVAADPNGDARVDLVVLNRGSADLSILYGNGDGTFAPARLYPVGGDPRAMAVGRFDADAIDDIVVLESGLLADENVSILLGRTDGELERPAKGRTPIGATSIASADFDADRCADIVVTLDAAAPVIVRGTCAGTFGPSQPGPAIDVGQAVQVSDLDGDGLDDFTVLDRNGESLQPALNWTAAAACRGDCDRDGTVTVAELVTTVMLTLDATRLARCWPVDRNHDERASVDELLGAVDAALNGCGQDG